MKCEDDVCTTAAVTTDANHMKVNNATGKLIYFGDPMCSWCWGITNHLGKLREEFKGRLDFEMVMGGLRPGGGELWNEEMKTMLRQHWEHVEEASGQPFNYALLDWDEFEYDTEPPARAVRVIRDLKPEKELMFYEATQRAFYVENHDPNTIDFYKPLCDQIEVSFETFKALFESRDINSW